jgi:hypothetical protein
MLTASEHDTALETSSPDTASPMAAHGQRLGEWAARPQGVRRDMPVLETADDIWDDAFASW